MPKRQSPKRIERGGFIAFDSHIYEIVDITDHGLLFHLTDCDSGEKLEYNWNDLLKQENGYLYSSSLADLRLRSTPLALAQPIPSAGLPPSLVTKAQKIVDIVTAVKERLSLLQDEIDEVGQTTVLESNVNDLGISLATYYKYLKRYADCNGSVSLIAASFRRTTFGKLGISPSQQHLIDTVIYDLPRLSTTSVLNFARSLLERTHGLWIDPTLCHNKVPQDLVKELSDPRIPIETILGNPDKAALLVKTKMVSRSFFFEYIRSVMALPDLGKRLIDERYGEGTWDANMKAFDTFIHLASYPLQYVFADHYLIEVFVVDKETRSKRKRLWLTVLIDAYSRCIIGIALLWEGPCIESIQTALYNTIWPKDVQNEFGIEGEWLGNGIPIQLFLDNAWAHSSYSLEELSRLISQNGDYDSIDLVHRRPYMGRHGALVEAFFGNLVKRIRDRLNGKGAIQSSDPKDVRNAAREACLLYEDIYRFILEEIVIYQNTPHSGLNHMTPNAKWKEATETSVPLVPAATEAFSRLFLRMHYDTRKRTPKGIALFGLHYTSPKLRAQPKYDRNGELEYTIRYDPLDISHIAVFHGDRFIDDANASELRQSDGTYAKVSLAEREIAQELAYQAGSPLLARDWVAYFKGIDETYKQRVQEQREAAKQQKGEGRSAPKMDVNTLEKIKESFEPDDDHDAEAARFLSGFSTD